MLQTKNISQESVTISLKSFLPNHMMAEDFDPVELQVNRDGATAKQSEQ